MTAAKERTERRLLLTGLPYFVRELEQKLTKSGHWSVTVLDLSSASSKAGRAVALLRALSHVELWYQAWGHVGRGPAYSLAARLGVPVVMHWVGHDVCQAGTYYPHASRSLSRLQRYKHWAAAPWLVQELAAIGIESEFVPLPLSNVERSLSVPPEPLPDLFTVLTYFVDDQVTIYGGDLVMRLARELPSVRFLVAGASGASIPASPANVEFLGWVKDMLPVYARSTVLVRMTAHDGYGGTVQEALASGRHAIWTYPFPGALHAPDYATLRMHVLDLLSQHERGALPTNEEGRRYMATRMRTSALSDEIECRLGRILSSRRSP